MNALDLWQFTPLHEAASKARWVACVCERERVYISVVIFIHLCVCVCVGACVCPGVHQWKLFWHFSSVSLARFTSAGSFTNFDDTFSP